MTAAKSSTPTSHASRLGTAWRTATPRVRCASHTWATDGNSTALVTIESPGRQS